MARANGSTVRRMQRNFIVKNMFNKKKNTANLESRKKTA